MPSGNLTGHLSFNLLLAAIITWPIALGLLRLYTRAVRRSMHSQTPDRTQAGGALDGHSIPAAPVESTPRATLHDLPVGSGGTETAALLSRLIERPRRAALVYAVAGIAFGLVMTAAQLRASGIPILPLRFLFLFWVFAWPVVLTVGIVAGLSRAGRFGLTAGYFVGLATIGAIGMRSSPDLTWGQVFLAWILYGLPPTLLLLTYLSRGVRAVGPLVLTFLLLGLMGSDLTVSFAGTRDSYLRAIIRVTSAVGLGGTATFFLLQVVGFLLFSAVGWLALVWIRRLYQAKQIGDESVTIDAIWILFAMVYSMDLIIERPIWGLASLAALGVYKICVLAGFAWWRRLEERSTRHPALLILRSFSIGRDSERLFDVIDRAWRRVGSIQMIAGIDLARRTVEPHEFLDFVSGKLARRFIDGPAAMEQRMRERDPAPDRDLRFRVNDFFCHDDTWRMVLSRLVNESDAVLMDLRGFTRQNAGCVFELHELTRLVPLDRVVFVVDYRTDETLLAETLGGTQAGVYRLTSMRTPQVHALLRSLADAATSASTLSVEYAHSS